MSDPALRIFGSESPLISEFLATLAPPISESNVPPALRAFETWLNRAPRVSDLETAPLFDWTSALIDRGFSAATVDRYGYSLGGVARRAVAQGLLDQPPSLRRRRGRFVRAKTEPWSPAELSRIFAAVRTLRGTVAGIPAANWWQALIVTAIDLQQSAAQLLALPGPALDTAAARLTMGMCVYAVHQRTAAAIAGLATSDAPRLFPWGLKESAAAGAKNDRLLRYHFKRILKRAGLPGGHLDLFGRLAITGEDDPDILDKIDWNQILPAPPEAQRLWPKKTHKRTHGPEALAIDNRSDRTVRHFFDTVYIPRRLAYGSSKTPATYRATIKRLREFCLTDCTLDALTDDLVERFLAFWRPRRAIDSIKRMRGELLSIWRYAHRKGYVETQPRDVDEIRTPKRNGDCWSVGELDRLLTVAASVEGTVAGIPASLYWPALIIFLTETGLRKGAALQVATSNFDAEAGWIRAAWDTQKQKADQDLPLSPQTVRLILATQPAGRELLFPWPFTTATIDTRLRAFLKQAGLPSGRRDLWHKLRRTCATFTADVAGELEAQKQLGHAGISTTRKYIDVRKLRRARIVDNPELQRPNWKPRALLGEEPAQ